MRIAVCDDEKNIIEHFLEFIDEYKKEFSEIIHVDSYSSYAQFAFEENGQYDLIFMDIELEDNSGIDLIKHIREKDDYATQVVFVSGKDRYYRDVLDVMPMGFIDKPASKEEIFHFLDIARAQLGIKTQYFEYKKGWENFRIKLSDILYFENSGRLITIYTNYGSETFYGKINNIKEKLNSNDFVQCHTSYLVNSIYVKQFSKRGVTLVTGKVIPVSKKYSESILQFIG